MIRVTSILLLNFNHDRPHFLTVVKDRDTQHLMCIGYRSLMHEPRPTSIILGGRRARWWFVDMTPPDAIYHHPDEWTITRERPKSSDAIILFTVLLSLTMSLVIALVTHQLRDWPISIFLGFTTIFTFAVIFHLWLAWYSGAELSALRETVYFTVRYFLLPPFVIITLGGIVGIIIESLFIPDSLWGTNNGVGKYIVLTSGGVIVVVLMVPLGYSYALCCDLIRGRR